MASETISSGFESKMLKLVQVFRGNLNVVEYEGVVLGLIFLKYLSDRFESKYQVLASDPHADPEDKLAYQADNVFFLPREARWSAIEADAHHPTVGETIDKAMQLIEQENAQLKDVLPRSFTRPELDQRRLGDAVDLISSIEMYDSSEETDLLGHAYEYFLAKFAALGGLNAGEFYTPPCIVRTIVEVLEPYSGKIYDPCCGSGGMFVQSAKFIKSHQRNVNDISIYGQEANPLTWKMAHMNVAIRGLQANLGKQYADTFFDDQHPDLQADYIMANPPFNLGQWGQPALLDDARWKYGVPPETNANFAWLQHMIHHLAPDGRMGVALSNGSLITKLRGAGKIRTNIVRADLVEGVVSMPTQLFYATAVPVCLWFLNKHKKQPGKVLFVDAREMGRMATSKVRELTEDEILRIADTFRRFEAGTLENEKGYCAVKTLEEVAAADYVLTPSRYIEVDDREDDGENFAKKMKRLTSELGVLFKENHKLETDVRKQLASVGYAIK